MLNTITDYVYMLYMCNEHMWYLKCIVDQENVKQLTTVTQKYGSE